MFATASLNMQSGSDVICQIPSDTFKYNGLADLQSTGRRCARCLPVAFNQVLPLISCNDLGVLRCEFLALYGLQLLESMADDEVLVKFVRECLSAVATIGVLKLYMALGRDVRFRAHHDDPLPGVPSGAVDRRRARLTLVRIRLRLRAPLHIDQESVHGQGAAGNGVGAQSRLDGPRIGTGTADAAGSPPCCA